MDDPMGKLLHALLPVVGGSPEALTLYMAGLTNGIRMHQADPELSMWLATTFETSIGAANGECGEQAEQSNRGAADQILALVRAVKED